MAGVCDRCGTPFLTVEWPHSCLCRPCFLGGLTPIARAAELVRGAR